MSKLLSVFIALVVSTVAFGQQRIEGTFNSDSQLFKTENSEYHIDFFQNGIARIYQSGYVGLMDSSGLILIPPRYDQISDFRNNFARITIRKQIGLIDKTGEVIVEPFYGTIGEFVGGFAKCKIDYYDTRIINSKGNFINAFTYDFVGPFQDGVFSYIRKGNLGLLTADGKENVVIENYDNGGFNGLVNYTHNGAALVMDQKDIGKLFEFSEERAVTFTKIKDSIKFGFIDKKGRICVAPNYDRALPFKYGMSPVKLGLNWGVIDRDGKTILSCKYQTLRVLGENHFLVSEEDRYGVIDRNGSITIPIVYQSIQAIENNKFIVSKNGKFGVVDEEHKKILGTKYPTLIHLFGDLLITYNEKKWGVIKTSGKTVLPFKYDGIKKVDNQTGVASIYRSSFSLNTGLPRYVFKGISIEFDKNGVKKAKSEPFSATIEMVGDYHDKNSVTKRGPNLFAPNLLVNSNSIEGEDDGYDFVLELKGGFKIVGIIDKETSSTDVQLNNPLSADLPKFKKGVINSEGDFVIPMIYNEIRTGWSSTSSFFGINEPAPSNLLIIKLGQLYGVITLNNEIVVPIVNESIYLYPGIILLTRTKETNPDDFFYSEHDEDITESGITDFQGNFIRPLKNHLYPNEAVENWFEDEFRGTDR